MIVSLHFTRKQTVLLAALFGLISIGLFSGSANALVTSQFPDADIAVSGGPSNNVKVSPAIETPVGANPSNSRNSPINDLKVFYKISGAGQTPLASFNVLIEDACEPPDFNAINTDISIAVHRVNPDGTTNPAAISTIQSTTPGICDSNNDATISFLRTDLQTVPNMYGPDYGVIVVRAQKINAPGVSSIRIIALDGNGLVTYSEQDPNDAAVSTQPPYNAFAIFDPIDRNSNRQYVFDFKPSCDYITTHTSAYLKWFDADAAFLESNSISFTIDRRDGGGVNWGPITIDPFSAPINIGDDGEYRSLELPMGDSDDYYHWEWNDVTGLNGIMFWMPFSEINTTINNCVPPAGSLACSVTVPPAINAGANFTADFVFTNNTASIIDAADQYRLGSNFPFAVSQTNNYMAPDVANWVRSDVDWGPGPILPGQSRPWSVTFTARQPSLIGGEHTGAGPYSGVALGAGSHPFGWRIVQAGNTWVDSPCIGSTTVNIIPAPVSVTCSVISNPVNPSVGQAVRITGNIQNAGPAPVTNGDFEMTLSASNGVLASTNVDFDGNPGNPGNDPVAANGGTGSGFADGTATGMGTFNATVILTPLAGGPPITCTESFQISAKPYVKFFGADVNAGGSFNDGGTYSAVPAQCAVPGAYNGTGIKTFARNDLTPQAYHGSSVEFAAFSIALIEGDSASTPNDAERGFYSASLRGQGSEGLYLTFSNTAGPYGGVNDRWSATYWGGEYNAAPRCIEDYYSTTRLPSVANRPAATLRLDQNGGGGGISDTGQYQAGNASGGGQQNIVLQNNPAAPFTNRVTLYVDGNLYIDDDIVYGSDFSTGIPYLTIITKGNIYIDNSVTNVDALLIAQPTDASGTVGGRVYTCATRAGTNFTLFASNQITNQCNQRLVINGAIIAQQIRFLRTNGTLNSATALETASSGRAAEIVNSTPEFIIGTPLFKPRSGTNTGSQTYHAIQALPPVF